MVSGLSRWKMEFAEMGTLQGCRGGPRPKAQRGSGKYGKPAGDMNVGVANTRMVSEP